jgi:chromosome segregation ATPase
MTRARARIETPEAGDLTPAEIRSAISDLDREIEISAQNTKLAEMKLAQGRARADLGRSEDLVELERVVEACRSARSELDAKRSRLVVLIPLAEHGELRAAVDRAHAENESYQRALTELAPEVARLEKELDEKRQRLDHARHWSGGYFQAVRNAQTRLDAFVAQHAQVLEAAGVLEKRN